MQPDYVTYDSKGREAFLSQIGNFTPAERELFHRIARMWSPEIPYSSVLSIASSESVTAKTDIDGMVRKLRLAKAGLMTTTLQEGNRVPANIILTNPDDYFFYHKLVEEELMDVVANISLPLPSQLTLASKNIQIPEKFLSETSYQALAELHGQKEVPEFKIYRLEAKGVMLYFTSHTVKRYITVALAKMQAYLQNSNLASLVAQMKNLALMDLKKQTEARDPGFWMQMTKDLLERRDEIKGNRKVAVDEHFWNIAYFLYNFLFNQVEELKKRRKAEEDKLVDMQTISEQVRKVPTFVMRDDQFSEVLMRLKEKYGKGFFDFKDEFEKRYLEAPERKALPPLVHLSRSYVHQDNLHALFLMHVDQLGRTLFAHYVKHMEHYLKRPNDGATPMFYSKENFENDINDRVKEFEPFFAELLQRPNLVAEAIILSLRKHKDVKTAEDMRVGLQAFFYADKIRFRDASVIFGLNLVEVFRFAFLKLGILRQFIMKMTGKHDSFRNKFEEFTEASFGTKAENGESGEIGELAESKAQKTQKTKRELDEERARRVAKANSELGSRAKSQQKTAAKTIAPPVEKKPKSYSQQEQETAWQSFGKTIKK